MSKKIEATPPGGASAEAWFEYFKHIEKAFDTWWVKNGKIYALNVVTRPHTTALEDAGEIARYAWLKSACFVSEQDRVNLVAEREKLGVPGEVAR